MQPLTGAAAAAAEDDDVMMMVAPTASDSTPATMQLPSADAAPAGGGAGSRRTLVAVLSFGQPLGLWLHKPNPTGHAVVVDVDPAGQAAAAGVVAGAVLTRIGTNAIVQVDPASGAVAPVLESALRRYIRDKADEAAACIARGMALDAEKCTREFEFVLP